MESGNSSSMTWSVISRSGAVSGRASVPLTQVDAGFGVSVPETS